MANFPVFIPIFMSSSRGGGGYSEPVRFKFSKFAIKVYKVIEKRPNITLDLIATKVKRTVDDCELNAVIRVFLDRKLIKQQGDSFYITSEDRDIKECRL